MKKYFLYSALFTFLLSTSSMAMNDEGENNKGPIPLPKDEGIPFSVPVELIKSTFITINKQDMIKAIEKQCHLQNSNGQEFKIKVISGNVSQESPNIINLQSASSDSRVWGAESFNQYQVIVRLVGKQL